MDETLVHLAGDLGLVLVEVVGGDVRDGLDVAVLEAENVLVALNRLLEVVYLLIDSADLGV